MTRTVERATLVRVGRMYYELGETQESIAAELGVTRAHVSKLLKLARSQGVVEIRIVDRTDRRDSAAADLRAMFDLRAVHVAPTFSGSEDRTRRRVGRLAAQVLQAAIRDGMILGVGDGSSIAALADELDPGPTPLAATVVPLCGGFWGTTGGREPFHRISEALGATAHGLLAPGLLDDTTTRDALRAHAGIREVTDLWERLDVAVFGIGGPAWSEASVGPTALAELDAGAAVGEILICPFDVAGRFVETSLRERTMACDARQLHRVPISIAVASGRAKAAPILGALRTGACNVFVTDAETAALVLELADRPGSANPKSDEHPEARDRTGSDLERSDPEDRS